MVALLVFHVIHEIKKHSVYIPIEDGSIDCYNDLDIMFAGKIKNNQAPHGEPY